MAARPQPFIKIMQGKGLVTRGAGREKKGYLSDQKRGGGWEVRGGVSITAAQMSVCSLLVCIASSSVRFTSRNDGGASKRTVSQEVCVCLRMCVCVCKCT